METVKAIIVDDEEINRVSLIRMIDQFLPEIQVIGKAESVQKACELIRVGMPGLVFLDVEMPEESGFEIFKHYPDPPFSVIFTTAHAGYALKAIKFAALDYLLKPINLNELKGAVNKAIVLNEKNISRQVQVLKNNTDKNSFNFRRIAIPTQEGMDFYEVSDIIRCETDRMYTRFFMTGGKSILAAKPMRDFEDILEESLFLRVHRSSIINLRHVKRYFRGQGGYLVMSDDSQVEVSPRKKEELLMALQVGKKIEL